MTTIKFRRDTSANWTSVNPIPAQGEPCYETDTGKLKIGNGSDSYTVLPYVSDDGDLPIASTTTLGAIKVGDNLTIAADGTLSASATGTTDYTQLENKPQINSIELSGNKTLNALGIQPAGNYATTADIPTKTSELTNDSGFLTEAPIPTNMVTTDTTQTITGSKTFVNATISNTAYIGNEITFNGTGATYINSVKTISGNWRSGSQLSLSANATMVGSTGLQLYANSGDVTIGGKTSSGKVNIGKGSEIVNIYSGTGGVFINGNDAGVTLSAGSSANITCQNKLIAPSVRTTANGTIELVHPTDNVSGLMTIRNNYGQLSISTTSDGINLLSIARGTLYVTIDADKIVTKDVDGNLRNYINSQNVDTTYMKWDTNTSKLTVDTAAVAHLAMPSSTKVELTLGASGTVYTAPADGYVSVSATSTYTGWIKVDTRPGCYGYANGGQFITNTPVVKNTNFKVWYSFSSGNVSALQYEFYYCNGTIPADLEPDF